MSSLQRIFSLLQPKKSGGGRAVGIDIGSSSVKVVELEDREGKVALTTYGELQLGPYAEEPIGQSVTLDQKAEKQALVDMSFANQVLVPVPLYWPCRSRLVL